jgi:hypothetical protein
MSNIGATDPCSSSDAAVEHELEQPYIRCHESVTVAALARFLQERILSVAPGDLTVNHPHPALPCLQASGNTAVGLTRNDST